MIVGPASDTSCPILRAARRGAIDEHGEIVKETGAGLTLGRAVREPEGAKSAEISSREGVAASLFCV